MRHTIYNIMSHLDNFCWTHGHLRGFPGKEHFGIGRAPHLRALGTSSVSRLWAPSWRNRWKMSVPPPCLINTLARNPLGMFGNSPALAMENSEEIQDVLWKSWLNDVCMLCFRVSHWDTTGHRTSLPRNTPRGSPRLRQVYCKRHADREPPRV